MPGFVDPYADPATGILRNLAGAATQDDLDQIEADVVQPRTVDLSQQRIKAARDLIELRAIHRYLFQDVYAWAGDLRTVDIRKNIEGSEFFVPVSLIERAATFTATELAEDNQLRGMNHSTFTARLAHHYDQLNYSVPRGQRSYPARLLGPSRTRCRLAPDMVGGDR